ncbi:hypothetical protein A2U01_0043076, partial [Trifolium medium]|nr:hypothetical protein [Trifolium medium]
GLVELLNNIFCSRSELCTRAHFLGCPESFGGLKRDPKWATGSAQVYRG